MSLFPKKRDPAEVLAWLLVPAIIIPVIVALWIFLAR